MALSESFEKSGNWLFRHRSYLPIPVFLIGSVMVFYTEMHPETFFLQETPFEIPYEMICLIVSLFGLAIRVFAIGYAGKNTSGRNVHGQVADGLNTKGIYSVMRHPLYVGNFFMWIGVTMLAGNFWFLMAIVLFFWIYYERIMFAEEQFLLRKFGSQYREWAMQTPAVVPAFRKYSRPEGNFQWKKVILQEKTGVMLVFLVYAFFDVVGAFIESHRDMNMFLLVMLGLSVVYYIVAKLVKKHTRYFAGV